MNTINLCGTRTGSVLCHSNTIRNVNNYHLNLNETKKQQNVLYKEMIKIVT